MSKKLLTDPRVAQLAAEAVFRDWPAYFKPKDQPPTLCEECIHWQQFEDADSGRCPTVQRLTDPDDSCVRADSKFKLKKRD